ncbi:MAG: hypothetical protein JWO09_3121 [Bacteroidetes bacterium]|nr:hypothetical protein [Bacteroidota bacterium]
MKLIPFYKITYRLNLKTEEELERLLHEFVKPDIRSTSFLTLPNSDKVYQGRLDTEKNEFTLIRNYGLAYGSNIIQAKGTYKKNEIGSELTLTVRPNFVWLLLPLAIMTVGFIFGNNIVGPFILFLITYFLVCVIPINVTGQRMTEDLSYKLRRHLLGMTDLATGISKY